MNFDTIDPAEFTGRAAGHINPKDDQFNRFVDACLFSVRNIYVMQGRLPLPMIVIADKDDIRPLPSPGGTLGTTLPWIREQMSLAGADTFFFAMQTEVGFTHQDDFVDPMDKAVIEDHTDSMTPGFFFYAATRAGSYVTHRHGVARFGDVDMGPVVDAPTDQPVEVFDAVIAL